MRALARVRMCVRVCIIFDGGAQMTAQTLLVAWRPAVECNSLHVTSVRLVYTSCSDWVILAWVQITVLLHDV